MTKKQAYVAAESQYTGKTVYMLELLNADGVHATSHTQLDFSAYQFSQIESRDIWVIYYKEHFRNMLRLIFEDGKVTSIYRHRQVMEFP